MAMRCCHPILLWMFNFLLVLFTTLFALLFLFTSFSTRPHSGFSGRDKDLSLTVAEKCTAAHILLNLASLLFLHTALGILSSGDHRDFLYRIEKEFKVLCALTLLSVLTVAILAAVIFAFRDTGLTFTPADGQPTTADPLAWFRDATTTRRKQAGEVSPVTRVDAYIYCLLVADLLSLVLTIVGCVTVVGCNRRERYHVQEAVERRELRSRANSPSSLYSRQRTREPRFNSSQ